jgi:hypothetical protein
VRVVPARSAWLQLAAVFGGFLVGPYAALRLSAVLAPGSDLLQTVAVFAFVLDFVGGTLLWAGLGIATVVVRALPRLLRGRLPSWPAGKAERAVPPGYGAYLVLGVGFGLLVGTVAGLATDLTMLPALAAWTLLGTGYGGALWLAAHHGYLPFLEPE